MGKASVLSCPAGAIHYAYNSNNNRRGISSLILYEREIYLFVYYVHSKLSSRTPGLAQHFDGIFHNFLLLLGCCCYLLRPSFGYYFGGLVGFARHGRLTVVRQRDSRPRPDATSVNFLRIALGFVRFPPPTISPGLCVAFAQLSRAKKETQHALRGVSHTPTSLSLSSYSSSSIKCLKRFLKQF